MAKLDVRVYPLKNQEENSTKAFASVTVEDLIAIKGIRVVEGTKGHFVTMPQSRDNEGNYHDIAFPVNGDLRKAMNTADLDEFKEVTKTAEKAADKAVEKAAGAAVSNRDTQDDPEL
jgi:stage V sporulation protein G